MEFRANRNCLKIFPIIIDVIIMKFRSKKRGGSRNSGQETKGDNDHHTLVRLGMLGIS